MSTFVWNSVAPDFVRFQLSRRWEAMLAKFPPLFSPRSVIWSNAIPNTPTHVLQDLVPSTRVLPPGRGSAWAMGIGVSAPSPLD